MEKCESIDCESPFTNDEDERSLWHIQQCYLCGSSGMHVGCYMEGSVKPYKCFICSDFELARTNNNNMLLNTVAFKEKVGDLTLENGAFIGFLAIDVEKADKQLKK